jgi:vancomycin permeability regulator SanA
MQKNFKKFFLISISALIILFIFWIISFIYILIYAKGDNFEKADVAVVFGAAVKSDGTASDTLYFRTMTAINLYKKGKIKKIIFSGGALEEHSFNETEVMKQIAIKEKINLKDIFLEKNGYSTLATMRNIKDILKENNFKSVVLISHYFHLARIKMFSKKIENLGIKVYLYPARSLPLVKENYFIFRENIALIFYFFKTCNGLIL